MTLKRINVTMPEELYDEFYKYACRKGISISPFLQVKMQEFIEEEKEFEQFKKLKEEKNNEKIKYNTKKRKIKRCLRSR